MRTGHIHLALCSVHPSSTHSHTQHNTQHTAPNTLCQFPRAAITKNNKLCGLRQQTFIFSVLSSRQEARSLKARNLKSKCQQSHAFSETLDGLLPCLSTFQEWLSILVLLGLQLCHSSLCLSLQKAFSMCIWVCMTFSSSYKGTTYIGSGAHPLQQALILTSLQRPYFQLSSCSQVRTMYLLELVN